MHAFTPAQPERAVVDDGVTSTTTTVYLGNVEHVIARDGSSTWKRYLANGAVLITQDHNTLDTRTAETTHYLLRDHLGSLTAILDQYGTDLESFSYDAWGQRRTPGTAAMLALLTLRSALHSRTTTRGYTGHEMLDAHGIIHMNGRIYDPKLGRFLQADPIVQFPHYSQGWNTYSYVLNNPLTYTDPSGYFIGKLFKKVFKGLNKALGDFSPFLGIALLALPGMHGWVMQSWGHAFGFGFITGGIATGSLKGALFGGISAAAFYGIGKHFTALTGLAEGGAGHRPHRDSGGRGRDYLQDNGRAVRARVPGGGPEQGGDGAVQLCGRQRPGGTGPHDHCGGRGRDYLQDNGREVCQRGLDLCYGAVV